MNVARPMEDRQDREQLDLLAIFHFVLGGLLALGSVMALIQLGFGLYVSGQIAEGGGPEFQWMGRIMAVACGFAFVVTVSVALATLYSGVCLRHRNRYRFSFVVACVLCVFMPLGTILGVFSVVVLNRESVKQIYADTQ